MQAVNVTVANELAALPVLQAAVNAFALAAGAALSVARQMELVIEEIITNIIKFEYLPGQQELIELELCRSGQQLELSIRFKGIPFDIGYLQRCEQVSEEELLSGAVRGIGLHLVRQCIDELEYRNLGKQGQQIRIVRKLGEPHHPAASPSLSGSPAGEPLVPVQAVIRRMLPDEAATVSKLAYFAYNYTYVYDHIYDPELVRSLNREGRMISCVAVDQEQGEIVGHCALVPDQRSGLDELGIAFVNPRYRGSGCLNELTEHLLHEVRSRGSEGVFVMAVTSHPHSQKAAAKHGLRESALLVSRVQPIAIRNLHDQALARESLLFMVRLFKNGQRGRYHVPAQHRDMLALICGHLGIAAEFAATGETAVLPEQGALEQEVDHYQAGHIHIVSYGQDSLARVRAILHGWCLDRLETIYLYLPLTQPATAVLTAHFEELGFFFAGLLPGSNGNDRLLLQYLNNQRYGYGELKAATCFGQQLLEYVRKLDPNNIQEGDHAVRDHC